MKIAIASDHAGYKLKSFLVKILQKDNLECIDLGCENTESVDYPDYARKVVELIKNNGVDFGILVCSSGIGMSIMANKFSDVRAALCHDAESAKSAREHNNANIICLASKVCDNKIAAEIIHAFIKNKFSNEIRHIRRLKKIEENI